MNSSNHIVDAYGIRLRKGWKETTLAELTNHGKGFIHTGPFGSQLHAHDYKPEGTPVVMPQQLGDNQIMLDGIARISDDDRDRLSRHIMEEGDIVFSRRGDVTRRSYIGPKEAGWLCGTGCLLIRIKHDDCDNQYLSLFFSLPQFKDYITQKAVGATMPNLNQGILGRVPVILPKTAVQNRIVETLSAYTNLIENNMRRIKLLEDAARLLYEEWFVRLRFPGSEHSQFAESPLGRQPEGWRVVRLGAITSKIGSGATPRGGSAAYHDAGITLIRSMNVYDYSFVDDGLAFLSDEQADDLSNVSLSSRDILLNITGASVARCCMVPERHLPARVNQHVMIIRANPALVDPYFVLCAINSDERKRQLLSYARKGATREGLTKEMMQSFEIVLPECKILRQFCEAVTPMFQQREALYHLNAKLREARNLLLPRLMSGEIPV